MKILYYERFLSCSDDSPVTLLADSSLSRNRQPLFLPPHHEGWSLSLAPAVRISRLGKFIAERFSSRYYDAMTVVGRLRPSTYAAPSSAIDQAFDSSIVVGDWMPLEPEMAIEGSSNISIELDFAKIDKIISHLSAYFTLKHGDIIVPGDFVTIPDVNIGGMMDITLNNVPCLSFKIK